jgi:hypothetical protein
MDRKLCPLVGATCFWLLAVLASEALPMVADLNGAKLAVFQLLAALAGALFGMLHGARHD